MAPAGRHANVGDEAEVYREYSAFLDAGRDLLARFEVHGLAVPPRLTRLLDAASSAEAKPPRVRVPRMTPPTSPPAGFGEDWIWVPAHEKLVQVRNLVLAVLAESPGAVPVKALCDRVGSFRADFNAGSVANVGTSFERKGIIARGSDGWTIVQRMKSPRLHADYLWGPPNVFGKPEIAWYRREAIRHLLGTQPDGLQQMQIVRHLAELDWVPKPKTKDLVKMDLDALRGEGSIRQSGHSRKWVPAKKRH